MSLRSTGCALLFTALLAPLTAHAASYDYVVNGPASVYPDTNFDINVYLREILNPPESSPIVTQNGLLTAAVKLAVTSSTAAIPVTPAQGAANPDFLDSAPFITVTTTSISLQEAIPLHSPTGPMGALDGSGNRLVLVGTFSMHPGSAGNTSFLAEDFAPSNDTSTVLGTILDPTITTPYTVTVLPEPTTLTLLALGTLTLLPRRRVRQAR